MTQKLKISITENGITREATHPEYIAWLQLEESNHSYKVCFKSCCDCSKCILRPMCRIICSGHCKSILEGKTIIVEVIKI